jgi:hypothetical protein
VSGWWFGKTLVYRFQQSAFGMIAKIAVAVLFVVWLVVVAASQKR